MYRDKIEGSIKVDNYMKNESNISEENAPSSYKNIKM
jgi:hypothetical protein